MLTRYGEIPLYGPITHRPKVLAIRGVLASPEEMTRLDTAVGPDWDGIIADPPGNGRSPHLSETSIRGWAQAFDEVVDQLGPTIVVGLSVGGLIGLAMKKARHVIALDPPLVTGKLWPMLKTLQDGLVSHPHYAPWIENIFGVYQDRIQGQDYRNLLPNRPCPTDIICGSEPLCPERPLDHYPSFMDEPERLYAEVYAPVHVAWGAGHAVHIKGGLVLQAVLGAAMERVQAGLRQDAQAR